jgi:alpha-tubulin suppressor-like RCC1 family protein
MIGTTLRLPALAIIVLSQATVNAQPLGSMLGWGWNDLGQADPQPGLYRAVATGYWHSLALRADGSLLAWGSPSYLGATLSPAPVGNDFVSVAAGWSHCVALRADGSIVAWGFKGLNVPVEPEPGTYVAIAAGEFFSVALRSDGSLYAWGDPHYSCQGCQPCPGAPFGGPPWNPTAVPAGNDFVAISASGHFALAQRADGTLVGWGSDRYCQLRDLPTLPVVNFSAGHNHGVALLNHASFFGWGHNVSGQAVNYPIPHHSVHYKPPPSPFPTGVQSVHGGYYHSVISTGWTLYGWGWNEHQQASPPVVPHGCPVLQVSSSYDHGLALIVAAVMGLPEDWPGA